MSYLNAEGLASDPWEHQVLYDVFEPHARDYSLDFSREERRRYLRRFAERVFQRLSVQASPAEAADRSEDVWRLLGPASLVVFPEVPEVLRELGGAGYRLAVVSNWQCGLGHFCAELGLDGHFEHVIASAEIGSEKPEPGIFREACRRLGTPADRVLHVGDSVTADVQGARGAGLQAVLVQRHPPDSPTEEGTSAEATTEEPPTEAPTIPDLSALPDLVGLR